MRSRILDKFNLVIFLCTLGLLVIGLLAIYSATANNPQVENNFTKQLIGAIAGLLIVFIITFIPHKYIFQSSYVLYLINILLLVLVLFLGRRILGHTSWFSIGGFGIQPSEFAKITTILALSHYLSNKQIETDITKPRDFFIALVIGLFPVSLIMLQPDMGTSLVFVVFLFPLLYWAGMPNYILFIFVAPVVTAVCAFLGTYYFLASLVGVLIALIIFKRNLLISTLVMTSVILSGLSVNMVYNKLQPYQQKRIISVFTPEADALGAGYNIIQSKIAIGSGGMWGKGFMQGTQTQLKYIPEQWTDFIFCMIGEEFGFAGSIVVVLLFLILIWQSVHIAFICKNKFLSLCTIGFSTVILFHSFFNMGMTMGIMPIVGIPLPFMSYGISFLLSNLIMFGIIMNAYRNRKEYT